jgi:hypothetical protein
MHLDASEQESIRAAAAKGPDWQRVFELAIRHRVVPVLYQNMRAVLPDLVPEDVFCRFQSAYTANARRNLSYTSFLLQVLNLFSRHGIIALPFKGPVLAQDVYGDIGLRVFSDLDILVAPKDAAAAWELLLENGLAPEIHLNGRQREKYIKTEDNLVFQNRGRKIMVELHWEMTGFYLARPVVLDKGILSPLPFEINGRSLPNLAPEFLLLYLCAHGAKDGWGHLEQVAVIAELICGKPELDWVRVHSLARQWKCQRILMLGLCLAWRLFSVKVPETVAERVKADKTASLMAEEIIERLLCVQDSNVEDISDSRFSWFHIRLKDSAWEKARYMARLWFSPTKQEWRHFPVPARMAFVLYLLRPFRLFQTWMK